MSIFIYPYNGNSVSARALRDGLGAPIIRNSNSRFVGDPTRTVINWGNPRGNIEVARCRVINHPEHIRNASNKINFMHTMSQLGGNYDYPFWTNRGDVPRDRMIVCRHVLNGSGGEGIELWDGRSRDPDTLPEAPLYVQYVPKRDEFRLHMFMGEPIFYQKKLRRRDSPDEEVNWQIRNHDNGFIFAHNLDDLRPEPHVVAHARSVIEALGLQFGAIDIAYQERSGTYKFLEVNTAPGLTGTTLSQYVIAIRNNFG